MLEHGRPQPSRGAELGDLQELIGAGDQRELERAASSAGVDARPPRRRAGRRSRWPARAPAPATRRHRPRRRRRCRRRAPGPGGDSPQLGRSVDRGCGLGRRAAASSRRRGRACRSGRAAASRGAPRRGARGGARARAAASAAASACARRRRARSARDRAAPRRAPRPARRPSPTGMPARRRGSIRSSDLGGAALEVLEDLGVGLRARRARRAPGGSPTASPSRVPRTNGAAPGSPPGSGASPSSGVYSQLTSTPSSSCVTSGASGSLAFLRTRASPLSAGRGREPLGERLRFVDRGLVELDLLDLGWLLAHPSRVRPHRP